VHSGAWLLVRDGAGATGWVPRAGIAAAAEGEPQQQSGASDPPAAELSDVDRPFVSLLVVSALSVAFAHGGNDVGNAVGPLASLVEVFKDGIVEATPNVEYWELSIGAAGFVLGIMLLGSRALLYTHSLPALFFNGPKELNRSVSVFLAPKHCSSAGTINTVGSGLCRNLTPPKAFAMQTGAAISVLGSSALKLPVSTSHCLVRKLTLLSLPPATPPTYALPQPEHHAVLSRLPGV
jgi:PiT family inorganic phosphate transporter